MFRVTSSTPATAVMFLYGLAWQTVTLGMKGEVLLIVELDMLVRAIRYRATSEVIRTPQTVRQRHNMVAFPIASQRLCDMVASLAATVLNCCTLE